MAESNCIATCPVCGTSFDQRTGPGRKLVYCSKGCQRIVRRATARAVYVKRPPRPRVVSVIPCDTAGCPNMSRAVGGGLCEGCYKRQWKARQLEPKRLARAATPCATCGKPLGDGIKTKYCGKACRDGGEVTRTIRRTISRSYMAAKRARVVVQFDPHDVLERDGWRCQLCGVKTPKSLRGKNQPRSPELDHIVPLSKGGEHTPWNTQCLCRKCNRAKSDTAAGQLGLALVA